MPQRPDPVVVLTAICPNVYLEPPQNIQMVYPCILAVPAGYDKTHADNQTYRVDKEYLVTVIDREVDSEIADKVALLPRCRFGRHYPADSLHHFTFNVFF